MRKKLLDDTPTKSARREQKKRPRMRLHGRALISQKAHAGKKLAAKH